MSFYLNQVYDNKVIADKFEEQLLTKLNLQNYFTLDQTLTEAEGQIKRIKKYSGIGGVQHLLPGEGNTETMGVRYSYVDYKVARTQGEWLYLDDEYQSDEVAIQEGLNYMEVAMMNDYIKRAIDEFLKTSNVFTGATWTFANFVDAAAMLNREGLDGFQILISPKIEASVKKQLGDQLKYVEAFVRTGYIGNINDLPVVVSKAIPAGTAIIANTEAVTCFLKKGVGVETKRFQNECKNAFWVRTWDVIALTDDTKCVMMKDGSADMANITLECSNTGAECVVEADGTIRVVGEAVEAGVPSAWSATFPKTLTDGVILNLKGLIPAGGATIKQTNIALAAYADDPNVTKVGKTYQKSKAYDGTDPDYQMIVQYGKNATVQVGDVLYRIKGDFVCKHIEGTIL